MSGFAFDSATGVPIVRGSACVLYPIAPSVIGSRCGQFDTGGRFRIDSLAARRDTMHVSCEATPMYRSTQVVRVPVDLSERDTSDIPVAIRSAGCDMRPLVSVTGEFEGIYTPGFESSGFQPCDGGPSAWVVFSPDSSDVRPRKWPKPNDRFYPTYYVRWRATRTGPGRYGHMGMSDYLLTVHRTLEVRRAGKHDCR